jgi:hypothetical protein
MCQVRSIRSTSSTSSSGRWWNSMSKGRQGRRSRDSMTSASRLSDDGLMSKRRPEPPALPRRACPSGVASWDPNARTNSSRWKSMAQDGRR